MIRRSGTRIGVRTGFGWISAPIEELGPGTQFLLLLSETFVYSGRVLRPFFRTSGRKKSSGANLIFAVIGLSLYPLMFLLFFTVGCVPWLISYFRMKRAAAARRRQQ